MRKHEKITSMKTRFPHSLPGGSLRTPNVFPAVIWVRSQATRRGGLSIYFLSVIAKENLKEAN